MLPPVAVAVRFTEGKAEGEEGVMSLSDTGDETEGEDWLTRGSCELLLPEEAKYLFALGGGVTLELRSCCNSK